MPLLCRGVEKKSCKSHTENAKLGRKYGFLYFYKISPRNTLVKKINNGKPIICHSPQCYHCLFPFSFACCLLLAFLFSWFLFVIFNICLMLNEWKHSLYFISFYFTRFDNYRRVEWKPEIFWKYWYGDA